MKFTAFKASDGDCILIEGAQSNILVDGGRKETFKKHALPALVDMHAAGKVLDLVCVSHIDDDHISGVVELYHRRRRWAAFHSGGGARKPRFDEPPEIKQVWHNGFQETFDEAADSVQENLNLNTQFASASATLANLEFGEENRRIAQGVANAMELQLEIRNSPMGIELNKPAPDKLIQILEPHQTIDDFSGMKLDLLGPFPDDFEKLREEWDTWVAANQNEVAKLKDEFSQTSASANALDFLTFAAQLLAADDRLGDLSKVTPPNLLSIMFLLEENNKTILMTGDGAAQHLIKGLEHAGKMDAAPKGIHVDVLKIAHHGATNSATKELAQRVTADHYVFCANGRHHNPEVDVLNVYLEARLSDDPDKATQNNAAKDRPFHFWFNYHPEDEELKPGSGTGKSDRQKQMELAMATVEQAKADDQQDLFDFTFSSDSKLEIDL